MNEPTPNHLFEELLQQPTETEWLEFKVNNAKPDELGEYLSALSNAACLHDKAHGYLIFGVEDKTHNIVGTSFKPREAKMGNEEIENWLARNLTPRIDFKIHEITYDNHFIVIFVVDATHTQPVAFKGSTFIRVGSYKKKLSDYPEKERKIWSKTSIKAFEKKVVLNNVNADDVLRLLDYSSYFRLLKLILPANKKEILDQLESEHFIQKNFDHSYNILAIGAILFAINLSDFSSIRRKAIRVIIYKDNNRLTTLKEKEGAKGYAVGFEYLISYIADHLPQNEIIEQALRKDVKMFPPIAIRELVANSLIHQDFSEVGNGPMIEIFKDRVEITNPGKPLINTLRFLDHPPQSRNEKLAAFLRRANICEERGSGIDKVIDSVEAFQLPAPKFIADDNHLKVILYSHKPLNKMDKEDKIRACYQHCCLRYVTGDYATNSSLRHRFNVKEENYSIVSRIISDTLKEKLIKPHDPKTQTRKYAKYVPFWAQ